MQWVALAKPGTVRRSTEFCPVSLPAAESTPRKVSRLGFDVTPLSAEQKAQEAAQLTDFQR